MSLGYKVCFLYGNGTGFSVNGNTTVFCMTFPKPTGVLGIAFVQKKQFITRLNKALKDPNGNLL